MSTGDKMTKVDKSENSQQKGESIISGGTESEKSVKEGSSTSGASRPTSASAGRVITVVATTREGEVKKISYQDSKMVGSGSFGVVYEAFLTESGDKVAIKKVLQDRRYKNRELQVIKSLSHENIVHLQSYFYSRGQNPDEIYLHLVLDFLPETIFKVCRRHYKLHSTPMPLIYVELYIYQLFRSLAYLHKQGICHRDIKPQNLLVDTDTGVLKLCDFGSSKQLLETEPNVSYICSRYYRAPELIFGAVNYTTAIDIWSTGCVFAEMLLGRPVFCGENGVDQLVKIIKALGTPTQEQIHQMNPDYNQYSFPAVDKSPWSKILPDGIPQSAYDLAEVSLCYNPADRVAGITACAHPFFDNLRNNKYSTLPNGAPLPPLFNFTDDELHNLSSNTIASLTPAKN